MGDTSGNSCAVKRNFTIDFCSHPMRNVFHYGRYVSIRVVYNYILGSFERKLNSVFKFMKTEAHLHAVKMTITNPSAT